jgi:predicted tellurium resistance membrane protein TerC
VEWISDPNAWIALLTLAALEIVLGIDNVIFISILANKLPENQRDKARRIGLLLALGTRVLLLLSLAWIIGLEETLFSIPFVDEQNHWRDISGRDLVLILGGIFLIGKSTHEIHHKVEGGHEEGQRSGAASFAGVLVQIALLDIVFSLDSVITAVGMADEIVVMIIAVIIAIGVMLVASGPIANFVGKHPTVAMLALSFLLLIGTSLIAEGFDIHIPKGYIYGAMGFSVLVEALNLRSGSRRAGPIHPGPSPSEVRRTTPSA